MKREETKWQDGRDVWWQDVVPNFPTKCDVEWVDAEDPLFLLYTSGSTGKPKVLFSLLTFIFLFNSIPNIVFYLSETGKQGVLHTTGGYMVYTATTFKYAFDYKPSDIYWYK